MAKFDIKELNKNLPKPYLIESDIPGKSYWTYDEPGDVSWNTDSTLTNKLWGTNQLPWDDFVKQEKDKTKYNFAANAPDDKEGLAKALAELDGPEPGTGFKPIPKDDQLMTKFDTWESADAWAKQIHNQQAARDTASRSKYNSQLAAAKKRLAAATTDDAKKSAKAAVANAQSGLDFLNKYQVYQGEDHWVNSSQVESEWRQSKDYWDYQNQQDQLAQLPDQDFSDKQGFWTKEQLDSIDPQFLKEDVRVGDPIEGSFSPSGKAFTSGQDSEKSIQTLQRESDLDWLTPETKPAGTNTVPLFLRGIPEKERYKHFDNNPYRDIWDINKLPSSDETLMASADQNNLKITTDTDTDVARAEKQREVIDKNLGFGIARDWETTNKQIKDISTNAASLLIDPAKLPRELFQKGVRGAMDQLERVGNIDTPWDWADSALDTVGHVGRSAGAAQDALHGIFSSWGQQTGLNNYTYDDPFQAKISDRELQRTAEATKAWADTLTRDQRVDLYNRQQAGERNRLTPDQYGDVEAGMLDESKQGTLNYMINKPAFDDTKLPGLAGQYNVLNNVQDVVWKELPTGQIVPSGLRDNWQLDAPSDFGGIGRVAGTNFNVLEAINTGARNIGRTLGIHNESNPNFAPQGYKRTDGGYQGTMRMPTMLDFGKYTPKATYTGQGQQKFGKNLTGISSNLISPSTGGGSSAMKIQSANKKGFGY